MYKTSNDQLDHDQQKQHETWEITNCTNGVLIDKKHGQWLRTRIWIF